ELPSPLDSLLTETDPRSRSFRHNIRMYNSALAFTSIGAKIDPEVTGTSGIYTFRIHGEMYHRIGTLLPDIETQPQFAQIYIFDTDNELQNRLNIMPRLDSTILIELQQMLHDINPYVNVFQQAANLLRHDQSLELKLIITDNRTKDLRRYNAPNASEVAIIMVGNAQGAEQLNRDIVLHTREGGLQRISELHCSYAPLHYVLMFPRGEDGWHPDIPISDTSNIQDEEESDINNEDEE
ncbi:22761_t:CDS:1, partial [Cetraspora pellucida]